MMAVRSEYRTWQDELSARPPRHRITEAADTALNLRPFVLASILAAILWGGLCAFCWAAPRVLDALGTMAGFTSTTGA